MESQTIYPRPRRRRGRALWFAAFVLVLAALLGWGWRVRVAVATQVIRQVLKREGLSDLSFRLTGLGWGRVEIQGLRFGEPTPLLEAGRAEVRFTIADLLKGRVDHVAVSGVRTGVVAEKGRLLWPLYERAAALLKAKPPVVHQAQSAAGLQTIPCRSGSIRDLRVDVRGAEGGRAAVLKVGGGWLVEADGKVRVWGDADDGGNAGLNIDGTVDAATGKLTLSPSLRVKDLSRVIGLAKRVFSERDMRSLPPFAVATGGLNVSGRLQVEDWGRLGPFEMNGELGRNSLIVSADASRAIRFQTFRVEASGVPDDFQLRASAGVSGFRWENGADMERENGRWLSLRGEARVSRTATNQVLRVTVDSELPGRSVARVLPRLLPVVPRLFMEGGTLRAESEVARPLAGGAWQGDVRFKAEARQSSVPLAAGRAGAGYVSVAGRVGIDSGALGDVSTVVVVEDGFLFRPGIVLRGGGSWSMTAEPPYQEATGVFHALLNESRGLRGKGVALPREGVRVEGEADVSGLATNPLWRLAVRIPEFEVTARQGALDLGVHVGATGSVSYGADRLSAAGDVWARDAAGSLAPSGTTVRAEGGWSRAQARLRLLPCDPSALSNAVVESVLSISNGWVQAGNVVTIEQACVSLPLSWSEAEGLRFREGQGWGWSRLQTMGGGLRPGLFEVRGAGDAVELRAGLASAGCPATAECRIRVPVGRLAESELSVTVPEFELRDTDELTATLKSLGGVQEMGAKISAAFDLRLAEHGPRVLGRVKMAEGRLKKGEVTVSGVASDVPFEATAFFRTIGRPVLTFNELKAGNVRLSSGKIDFQATPDELFVDRAEVGWCKGNLNAYSIHCNLKNPRTDFVVYADRIDLGEALMMVMPLQGEIEGVLYGRFPVGIDKRRVRLSTGFLYSLPGQGGRLKLTDSVPMSALLERAGIGGDVRQPLSNALSDMTFDAIRIELEPKSVEDAVLRLKLDGKSNCREWPAPVDLNLNLHGPLEQLVNVGLDLSKR